MASKLIFLLIGAIIVCACSGPRAAAAVVDAANLLPTDAPIQMASPQPAATRSATATAVPTAVDFRGIWPLGREFYDTATVKTGQTYRLDYGDGVKIAIENRSRSSFRIDEPTLYYYMSFLGKCPELPKLVMVDGSRNAEIMMEYDGLILVTGSERASMTMGLTGGCLAATTGFMQKPLKELVPEGWDKAVHYTAVLLGMTYDEYVDLTRKHDATAVECGVDDCKGYKGIAAEFYAAQVLHAPVNPSEP